MERDIIWLPAGKVTAKQIIEAVAERNGVSVDDLTGPARFKRIAHARQEAMWELKIRTGRSLPWIGRKLNRDHTTVLHGVRAHERRLAEQERAA